MRDGFSECVVAQAGLLRVSGVGLEVVGVAGPKNPDIAGRGQVEHPEGAVLSSVQMGTTATAAPVSGSIHPQMVVSAALWGDEDGRRRP